MIIAAQLTYPESAPIALGGTTDAALVTANRGQISARVLAGSVVIQCLRWLPGISAWERLEDAGQPVSITPNARTADGVDAREFAAGQAYYAALITTAPPDGSLVNLVGVDISNAASASVTATPSGPAGGDLSGAYPNPTVAKIQGRTVSSAAPATNDFLIWDGAQWEPGTGTTSSVLTGLTLFAAPVAGEIGYASGNNTVSRAIATSLAASRAVGVYTGTANTLSTGPRVGILLEAGLNAGTPPAAGQPIFISASTGGRGTNVAPSTATQVEARVAILLDATGYNNATGSVQDCAWQVTAPIQL